jgi:hypothetical protein
MASSLLTEAGTSRRRHHHMGMAPLHPIRQVCLSDPGMLLPLFVWFLNLAPLQFLSTDLWVISRKKSVL